MTAPDKTRALADALRRRFPRALLRPGREIPTQSTGVPALDALLPGGGLPRGRLAVFHGAPSSGRTGLALAAVAHLTSSDEGRAGWIDLPGTLHPPSAAAAGARLDRLLVVRPTDPAQALSAAAELLRQQAAGLVVVDLSETAPDALAATDLGRLARAVPAQAACLVLAARLQAGSALAQAASVGVHLARARAAWQRAGALARLGGLATQATLTRSRFGGEGRIAEVHLVRPGDAP